MIDKKRVGNYLKNLRLSKKNSKGKSFTQNDLVDEFEKNGWRDLSINSIVLWENGKVLPDLEKLEILSKIYGRTLDEILDGEDNSTVDLFNKYFIAKRDWLKKFPDDNLYQFRNEQIKIITARFKELISVRMNRNFTRNEESEFKFLFEHFYDVSGYAVELIDSETKDGKYIGFKNALLLVLQKTKNLSLEERYWEIQKLYLESDDLRFGFWSDVADLQNVPIIQERFVNLELWQKDLLLAMFQSLTPFEENADKYGAEYLKRYEARNGEFKPGEKHKDAIKALIKHGAMLNQNFLNDNLKTTKSIRIIDRLEELYDCCLRPIEISVREDDKTKTYLIENNAKNRFINNYYFNFKYSINGQEDSCDDIDELYHLVADNNEIPESVFLKIAKKENIDTNRERRYWMSDLKLCNYIINYFNDYKENEKKIANGLIEIEKLKDKLANGERYVVYEYEKTGIDEKLLYSILKNSMTELSYEQYLNGRNKKLTNNLLNEIDSLNLDAIREKYFRVEK